MKIGFVGLGRMGGNMSRRLLAHGCEVSVFDRDPKQTAPLAALGAHVAADLHELGADRDLVISMLPTDAILDAVVSGAGGLLESLPTRAITW